MAIMNKFKIDGIDFNISVSKDAKFAGMESGDTITTPTSSVSVSLLSATESIASIFNKMSNMFRNIRWIISKLGTADFSAAAPTISEAIVSMNTTVSSIKEAVPDAASSTNQLADKEFVNSSVATATATFRGSFTSLDELKATTGDNNDYAFYKYSDSEGREITDRYKHNGTEWVFEYTVNNTGLTSAQLAATLSGITKEKVDTMLTSTTYATSSSVGVMKATNGLNVDSSGNAYCASLTSSGYSSAVATEFISKGTLAAIGKSYTFTYTDGTVETVTIPTI